MHTLTPPQFHSLEVRIGSDEQVMKDCRDCRFLSSLGIE